MLTLLQYTQNKTGESSGLSLSVGFGRSRSKSGLLIPSRVIQEQADAERKAECEDLGLDYGGGNHSVESTSNKSSSSKPKEVEEHSAFPDKDSAVSALSVFRKTRTREVSVFGQSALKSMRSALVMREKNKSDNAAIIAPLKAAIENNGVLSVPKLSTKKVFAGLDKAFPNFADVIADLITELELATCMRAHDFRVRPILLDGAPSIGKTKFAQTLADRIGVPLINLPSSVLQTVSELAGSSAMWSNTQPGRVFRALAYSKSAVAIVLLDELDKIGDLDSRFPVLPSLLQLLEKESASRFVDACAEIEFDASRLIIIGTSNYLQHVDPALRSRLTVHQITEPDTQQRLSVMQQVCRDTAKAARKKIDLDSDAAQALAEAHKHDLRALIAAVRRGVGNALISGSGVAIPSLHKESDKPKGRGIGFMAKL